jgi:hypothetical protein
MKSGGCTESKWKNSMAGMKAGWKALFLKTGSRFISRSPTRWPATANMKSNTASIWQIKLCTGWKPVDASS